MIQWHRPLRFMCRSYPSQKESTDARLLRPRSHSTSNSRFRRVDNPTVCTCLQLEVQSARYPITSDDGCLATTSRLSLSGCCSVANEPTSVACSDTPFVIACHLLAPVSSTGIRRLRSRQHAKCAPHKGSCLEVTRETHSLSGLRGRIFIDTLPPYQKDIALI